MKTTKIEASKPVYKIDDAGEFILEDGKRVLLEKKEMSVEVSFPETLQECQQVWGEENTVALAIAAITVKLQAVMRNGIEAGSSDEEITAAVQSWKPGQKTTVKKDPLKAISDYIRELQGSDPERAREAASFLKRLAKESA